MLRQLLYLCLINSLFFLNIGVNSANECARVNRSTGIVCVCNSTYCDTVDPVVQLPQGQYVSYVSNKDGLRLNKNTGEFQSDVTADVELTVNEDRKYQTIFGFGGSFTDAFGINFLNLSEATRNHLLRSYFSEEGSEYNLCRVPIGATDFSTHGYTYDDTENDEQDLQLSNFSLVTEDFTYKIPLIKAAKELATNDLKLLASAWTAPKWMKTTKQYAGMLGFIKEEYYQTWADYYVKFLKAYKNEDLNFWGLTTGNEPSLAYFIGNQIPTNGWRPSNMRDWIANNLGPTIRNSEFSDIKLIGIDDQVFFYPWYPEYLLENENVSNYVDGFAVHWYWHLFLGRNALNRTHFSIPNKFLISSEACTGSYLVTPHIILGSWLRGTLYAIDIIEDLNRHVAAWIDWNMALDTTGGPTYIGNNVDSPIIVNAEEDEFYKNPMYYALTHFSKFIPPGSVRIQLDQSSANNNLHTAAFKRPDNGTTVVLINSHNSERSVSINDPARGQITLDVTADSFTTVLYW